MRKTNKKLKKLAADKYGVILVTVIFIVAMALVFITTALTISIATRQRVYTNAKYQQARLTVTSLAQSVWQAIYSQQISDRDLVSLAKSGAVIKFETNDVPGMGQGGTVATAYFFCINTGDPSKIGIEFKCDIDGATDGACQYYLMVLERNRGEDFPPSAFHLPVNLGGGGKLNNCNFGVDASEIQNASRDRQIRYDDPQNIVFLHMTNYSDVDGMGYYCRLVTDGVLNMPDAIFAWDVYFLGATAGMDLSGPGQNNACTRTLSDGSNQYGDIYFWGTTSPFRNGASTALRSEFTMYGVNSLNFDLQDDGAGHRTGFTGGVALSNQNLQGIAALHGSVYYESGAGVTSGNGSVPAQSRSAGWDPVVAAGMDDMLNVAPEEMDTIDEVIATYGAQADIIASATSLDFSTTHLVTSGTYVVDTTQNIADDVTFDLSGGSIVVLVTDGASINFTTGGKFFYIVNGSGSNRVTFLLDNDGGASEICIGGAHGTAGPDNCGIVDVSCFTGSDYTDPTKINQTVNPHCYILSLYTGGTPVRYEGNHKLVLTASLGFFPQSQPIPIENTGGRLYFHSTDADMIYYGRISAGGIECEGGGGNQINIPYCPPESGDGSVRSYAYRDNTDFSVVTDECQYYTATP